MGLYPSDLCSLCPSQLPLHDYNSFPDGSGALIPMQRHGGPHGGSAYLFFRHGLVSFLSFQGNVCVHLCLRVSGIIPPQQCRYLLVSCCDDLNNLIHLSSDLSFTKCTSILSIDPLSPAIYPVRGSSLLSLPSHFTVENIEALRGCPRSVSGRIRI